MLFNFAVFLNPHEFSEFCNMPYKYYVIIPYTTHFNK
jgi:hypothetical protein